jgi:hypothetical protein
MGKHANKIGYLSLGVITVALLVVGWMEVFNHRQPTVCDLCQRPIHANSRVLIEVGGMRKAVCCARCGITQSAQEHRPVRFIEVTDYPTGNRLKPEDAWFVDGSRKVLCDHDMAMMDESKHAQPLAFDRCSPGAYAFARREDAEAFARENGGVVVRLEEMMPGVAR